MFQFAALAPCLVQLLVFFWFLPTASLENRVMVTEVLASTLSECSSYEAQVSYAPWEYNSALNNLAGTSLLAEIANVAEGEASKLRLRLVGTARVWVGRISCSRRIVSRGRAAGARSPLVTE